MEAEVVLLLASLTACASGPSPRWQQGGAPIQVDSAYFSRSQSTIELRPSGEVIEDATLLFRVDRAGRVSEADGRPVAVLREDGWLVSEDDTVIGWIGPGRSLQADRRTESVRVLPTGDAWISGHAAGRWDYCAGAMLRTCTLITHVIAAREYVPERTGSSSVRDIVPLIELLTLVR
jgi:hypothetical protein